MGPRWVREFLCSLGLKWGQCHSGGRKQADIDAIPEARENFRLKIVCIRHARDIAADRVVNIDQTSVRVLPTSKRGWK
eukprot:7189977-Pyramimonas_sp.AAC.1